jgi:hypothetical protein
MRGENPKIKRQMSKERQISKGHLFGIPAF